MATAWWRCLAAAALFGAATPLSKALLGNMGPLTLAGLLYLGAAVATAPFAWPRGATPRRSRANVARLAGAVVLGGVLGPVLMLAGLSIAAAGSVSLWLNLETVATALLSWAFFREHLGLRVWAAVALIFGAGVALSFSSGTTGGSAALLVGLACLCWGADNNLTSVIDELSPAQTTCIKGAVAGGVNLSLGVTLEPAGLSMETMASALVLGMFAYGASIVLYVTGSQQLGATRSQLIFSAHPFIGLVLSWVLLKEAVLPVQVGAAALMATGLWLLLRAEHAHSHRHQATRHTHLHRHDDGHHGHTHPGLAPGVEHAHPHEHAAEEHAHPHVPDLHHRH